MKKIIMVLLFLVFTALNSFAQSGKVYVAHIEDEINLALAPYVRRVIDDAEKNSADAIIFKINTFGGRLDAATQIKDAILDSKIKTIAFIDKRAISAGALISLSCQKIVMVPGASIGASTVVDQTGQKQSEKYQSYMRGEMRSTAEKNGRRTDIAEGMVDETISIPGIVDSTKLVTLTTEEALKYGIADTVLTSIDDVLKAYGISNDQIISEKSNWAEDVVSFLHNPLVSSLLIMIGLVGLFVEIKTPGWGLAGTAAIIALTLFFGTNYILELASSFEITMFIIGVILLILEIFVIPGFGIAGVLGILLMMAGLFLGLLSDFTLLDWSTVSSAIIQLAGSFVATAIVVALLIKFLPKSNLFHRLVLESNIGAGSGYSAFKPDFSHLIGKQGTALTDLRPSGTVVIDGNRIDVVTYGEYIVHGVSIVVKYAEGSKIVVEEVK